MAKQLIRGAMRHARRSTCGDEALTRCCLYGDFFDDTGTCRVMTEASCDELDDRLFDADGAADDEGPGSCAPNPCTY